MTDTNEGSEGIEGQVLDRGSAVTLIRTAIDRGTAVACPPATVARAAEVIAELNLPMTAVIEGAGGWGALAGTVAAVRKAAEAGDLCVTLMLLREDGPRFARAYGYREPPGERWMVLGKVADPDAPAERAEIPPLFFAALEGADPAGAAWLLGDGTTA